jgi:hypothetical protein
LSILSRTDAFKLKAIRGKAIDEPKIENAKIGSERRSIQLEISKLYPNQKRLMNICRYHIKITS